VVLLVQTTRFLTAAHVLEAGPQQRADSTPLVVLLAALMKIAVVL
jgi:hypothetical protein